MSCVHNEFMIGHVVLKLLIKRLAVAMVNKTVGYTEVSSLTAILIRLRHLFIVQLFKAQTHCHVLRAMYYYVSHPYELPNFCPVLVVLGFARFLVGFRYVLLG
jgi:hypothetical protein